MTHTHTHTHIYIYIYIYIYISYPQTTDSNKSPKPSEVPNRLYHLSSVDLTNTTWAQKDLINQQAGNAYGSHGTKATIKYCD